VSSHYARPKWWQLYLTFPFLIVLFALENRLKISTRGHQVAQIVILLLAYGFIHLWLKANATVSRTMEPRQFHGTVAVMRVHPYKFSTSTNNHTGFQLSDPDLKGTLSDTFEMDYIDAEFVPMDEAVENSKKE
jgi:hypothetical protein